jgi:hypothetical protein
MKKHFVTFFSPGTFVAEQTTKEIDSWNVDKAMEMSGEILERYQALPYGFQFTTRERGEGDFDSKETERSGMYYLGGDVLTLEQLKAQNSPDDKILICNMEANKWDRVIVNTNSWKWTQPLEEGDIVLK